MQQDRADDLVEERRVEGQDALDDRVDRGDVELQVARQGNDGWGVGQEQGDVLGDVTDQAGVLEQGKDGGDVGGIKDGELRFSQREGGREGGLGSNS
jgi:hypothetical protein